MKDQKDSRLRMLQALPLELKIRMAKLRIQEFVNEVGGWDKVYGAFSGGKDSLVLGHIMRSMNKDAKFCFVDTGLEFPEIRQFVKEKVAEGWDIDTIRPKMSFVEVLEKYGYPVISKQQSLFIRQWRNSKSEYLREVRWNGYPGTTKKFKIAEKWKPLAERRKFKISEQCCDVMKKRPFHQYNKSTGRSAIIGTMVDESVPRRTQWRNKGCNFFSDKSNISKPLSIWMEADIWEYIKLHNLEVAKPYEMGYPRTGCVFCALGAHLDKGENRFQKLQRTHPKHHKYVMENLGMKEVLEEIGVDGYANCGASEISTKELSDRNN